MTRPDPATLDELLQELTLERFGPLDRHQASATAVDTPAVIVERRRVLGDALDEGAVAPVVPLRSARREAAA